MIERGPRHSWLHGSDRPGARVPAPAVRSQGDETPRGSVERRHSHIVNGRVSVERRHSRSRIAKKDVEDQCGFQTIDVFVGTGCARRRAWPISAAAHTCARCSRCRLPVAVSRMKFVATQHQLRMALHTWRLADVLQDAMNLEHLRKGSA